MLSQEMPDAGSWTDSTAEMGTVTRFDGSFGFIHPDNGGPVVFIPGGVVRASGISRLDYGDRVEFEIWQHPRGPRASKLRVLSRAPR